MMPLHIAWSDPTEDKSLRRASSERWTGKAEVPRAGSEDAVGVDEREKSPSRMAARERSLSLRRVDKFESPLPLCDDQTVGTAATVGTAGSSLWDVSLYESQLQMDFQLREKQAGDRHRCAAAGGKAQDEDLCGYKDRCPRLSAELAEKTRQLNERQREIDERRLLDGSGGDDPVERFGPLSRQQSQRRDDESQRRDAAPSLPTEAAAAADPRRAAVDALRLVLSEVNAENDALDERVRALTSRRNALERDLGLEWNEQCELTMRHLADLEGGEEERGRLRRDMDRISEEISFLRMAVERGHGEVERMRQRLGAEGVPLCADADDDVGLRRGPTGASECPPDAASRSSPSLGMAKSRSGWMALNLRDVMGRTGLRRSLLETTTAA